MCLHIPVDIQISPKVILREPVYLGYMFRIDAVVFLDNFCVTQKNLFIDIDLIIDIFPIFLSVQEFIVGCISMNFIIFTDKLDSPYFLFNFLISSKRNHLPS